MLYFPDRGHHGIEFIPTTPPRLAVPHCSPTWRDHRRADAESAGSWTTRKLSTRIVNGAAKPYGDWHLLRAVSPSGPWAALGGLKCDLAAVCCRCRVFDVTDAGARPSAAYDAVIISLPAWSLISSRRPIGLPLLLRGLRSNLFAASTGGARLAPGPPEAALIRLGGLPRETGATCSAECACGSAVRATVFGQARHDRGYAPIRSMGQAQALRSPTGALKAFTRTAPGTIPA